MCRTLTHVCILQDDHIGCPFSCGSSTDPTPSLTLTLTATRTRLATFWPTRRPKSASRGSAARSAGARQKERARHVGSVEPMRRRSCTLLIAGPSCKQGLRQKSPFFMKMKLRIPPGGPLAMELGSYSSTTSPVVRIQNSPTYHRICSPLSTA